MNLLHSLHQRFEISNLARNEKLHDLQMAIHTNPQLWLHAYTRRNFVLLGFRKLCRGELSLEDFFKLWDIESSYDTHYQGHVVEACYEIEQHLDKNPDYYRDGLVVIEQTAKDFFISHGGNFDDLVKGLKYVGAAVFVIMG